jgi:sulfur carrier protein ThiS
MKNNTIALEKSTNTHTLQSSDRIEVKQITDSILMIRTNGESIVTHGEHGTIKVESNDVIKYVQQEVNPVTKKMQNAFD